MLSCMFGVVALIVFFGIILVGLEIWSIVVVLPLADNRRPTAAKISLYVGAFLSTGLAFLVAWALMRAFTLIAG